MPDRSISQRPIYGTYVFSEVLIPLSNAFSIYKTMSQHQNQSFLFFLLTENRIDSIQRYCHLWIMAHCCKRKTHNTNYRFKAHTFLWILVVQLVPLSVKRFSGDSASPFIRRSGNLALEVSEWTAIQSCLVIVVIEGAQSHPFDTRAAGYPDNYSK